MRSQFKVLKGKSYDLSRRHFQVDDFNLPIHIQVFMRIPFLEHGDGGQGGFSPLSESPSRPWPYSLTSPPGTGPIQDSLDGHGLDALRASLASSGSETERSQSLPCGWFMLVQESHRRMRVGRGSCFFFSFDGTYRSRVINNGIARTTLEFQLG